MSLEFLADMEYPGRVIIIGRSPDGHDVALYAITGRSPSSQARKLVRKDNQIIVKPTDEEVLKKGDPDLLLYPAINFEHFIVVSNGKQTTDVVKSLAEYGSVSDKLRYAHENWEYEPDEPNYTPRISGCVITRAALGIIRRNKDGRSDKQYFEFPLSPGKGQMIATYTGVNVNPLPSWEGMPRWVGLPWENVGEAVDAMYLALGPKEGQPDFRVAVAGVYVDLEESQEPSVAIKNRHSDRLLGEVHFP